MFSVVTTLTKTTFVYWISAQFSCMLSLNFDFSLCNEAARNISDNSLRRDLGGLVTQYRAMALNSEIPRREPIIGHCGFGDEAERTTDAD